MKDLDIFKIIAKEGMTRHLNRSDKELSLGISSHAILYACLSKESKMDFFNNKEISIVGCHPQDPSDFSRCYYLLSKYPDLKGAAWNFLKKEGGEVWGRMIDNWESIETLITHDLKTNISRATDTYVYIKNIINDNPLEDVMNTIKRKDEENKEYLLSLVSSVDNKWINGGSKSNSEYFLQTNYEEKIECAINRRVDGRNIKRVDLDCFVYLDDDLSDLKLTNPSFRFLEHEKTTRYGDLGFITDKGCIMIQKEIYRALVAYGVDFSVMIGKNGHDDTLICNKDGHSFALDAHRQSFYNDEVKLLDSGLIVTVNMIKEAISQKALL